MLISRTQPSLVMRLLAFQKKSGEESSLPDGSSMTESYWMLRGLTTKRIPVFPPVRVSRWMPP